MVAVKGACDTLTHAYSSFREKVGNISATQKKVGVVAASIIGLYFYPMITVSTLALGAGYTLTNRILNEKSEAEVLEEEGLAHWEFNPNEGRGHLIGPAHSQYDHTKKE